MNVILIVQFNDTAKCTAIIKVTTGCVEQRVSIALPKDTQFQTVSNNVNKFFSMLYCRHLIIFMFILQASSTQHISLISPFCLVHTIPVSNIHFAFHVSSEGTSATAHFLEP